MGFYGRLPSPATVDKIVRQSLDSAISINASKEILAMAFLGDATPTDKQYSGGFVYRPSDKTVLTLNEFRGVKTTTSTTPNYFVNVEEEKTSPGIKPERRWLSMEIVFPKQPTQDVAYAAIVTEIQKVAARGLDVSVYVNVGDAKAKILGSRFETPMAHSSRAITPQPPRK